MRGLICRMTSQLNPWRSRAPGAKFSTSTSHFSISFRKNLLSFWGLGVDGDAALIAVEHGEIQAIDIGQVPELLAGDIASPRQFDFDDGPRQARRASGYKKAPSGRGSCQEHGYRPKLFPWFSSLPDNLAVLRLLVPRLTPDAKRGAGLLPCRGQGHPISCRLQKRRVG